MSRAEVRGCWKAMVGRFGCVSGTPITCSKNIREYIINKLWDYLSIVKDKKQSIFPTWSTILWNSESYLQAQEFWTHREEKQTTKANKSIQKHTKATIQYKAMVGLTVSTQTSKQPERLENQQTHPTTRGSNAPSLCFSFALGKLLRAVGFDHGCNKLSTAYQASPF